MSPASCRVQRARVIKVLQQTFSTEMPGDPDLMAKVGAIAHQLFKDLPNEVDDQQKTLLKRALLYAAETEQRMADQMERIALLENLSFTDPLTGLLNRRGFTNHLGVVLARARRYGEVGVIAYCDLDNFKAVNDSYGHATGDDILKCAADTLSMSVREIDVVGRLGGDEFAIILVNTNWKDGLKRVRTLQWHLDNASVTYMDHQIPIKLSLGAEPYGPHDSEEELIRRSDMAMYYNKRRKHAGLFQTAAE